MTLSHEEISKRAFEIWVKEGRPEGRDADIWYRAESELKKVGQDKQLTSKDPSLMKPAASTSKESSPSTPQRKDPQLTSQDSSLLKPGKKRKTVGV